MRNIPVKNMEKSCFSLSLLLLLLLQFSSLASVGSAESCSTEGELRLADGVSVNEGRVEVCVSGQWGTVCDHSFGVAEAHVVCNQLGLPAEYADPLPLYGGGSGPIHYAGFHCTGEETHLVNCTVGRQSSDEEITTCNHYEDAGVHCTNVSCVEDETRLLNEAVVQICRNKTWGLVCADGWDDNAARVLCKQEGVPSKLSRSASDSLTFYAASIVVTSAICTGSEDDIAECSLSYDPGTMCSRIAITQCEYHEPCNSTTDSIQLTWGSDRIGRLEVCSGNEWGTVCGDGATLATIAIVACRELNLGAGEAFVEADFFFLPLVPITRTNMMCTGLENALSECPSDGSKGNPDCDHSDDIIIFCAYQECNGSDVRLVDGQTPDDGRVEICINRVWSSVCDDRWDIKDAEVVCRQLQYNGSSYPLLSHDSSGTPPPIHLDDVTCDGTEDMLSECSHRGIGIHDCLGGVEEAGVICTNLTCENGTVHLVGGDDVSRGRVQYCYEGTWYSVCASGWEDNGDEARVVCSTLRYDTLTYQRVVTNFGRGTSLILPLSIQCGINDTTLSDCATTDIDVTLCPHVAGINCIAPCLTANHTDCSVCGSRGDCNVTLNGEPLCDCYSDCYEYGDCCSDVSHVENCVVEECETGEVRLVGGVTNSTGRLELCGNGIWGRVCNRFQYWGPDNARVVCRQLGFSEIGAYVVDDARVFGISERTPLFGEVHCAGSETGLFECSHSTIGSHQCGYNQTFVPDIAISCYDEATSCEDGEVRLEGGFSPSNGRVEFCQYRTWGAVCGEGWDDNDARVVCGQLGYSNPEDARAVEGFRMAEGMPVFLYGVECSRPDKKLSDCMNTVKTSSECSSAGVTCEKSSNTGRCAGRISQQPLNMPTNSLSFGKCETYGFETDVCNGALRVGLDNVYISNRLDGNQSSISKNMNSKIQNMEAIITRHSKECVEQVYRVICYYYLPPCGNITYTQSPSSLCQEECVHVEESCQATWQAAELVFTDPPFIDCEDTSQLLSPLPNCCTGAGIELPNIIMTTSSDSRGGIGSGAVAGIVMVILLLAVAAGFVTVLIVIIHSKRNKKKRMQRVQLDIMANTTPIEFTNAEYETPLTEAKPIDEDNKNDEASAAAAFAIPNPYSVPTTTNKPSSLLPFYENRARVASQYMRELSRGTFVVKYEDITLLDSIGEGEFGIVYKGRVSTAGSRSYKEVAVKTMKGEFDQSKVDQFVEESLKMSRFKHSHVMGLIGVCLDTGSTPFIVMPYMANGSLLKYLRRQRENIVVLEETDKDEVQEVEKRLMVMCSQIASGMEYLASEKYIHRDLAARNCMIDTHFLIKITDFGLSEDVFLRSYFRQDTTGDVVKLPVKWMAPESLSDGHFSEKSDVWSFGVVMWEVFSGGKAPYPGTDPVTLLQWLETGQRMPKPYNSACTDEIYTMMKRCWEKAPNDRPTFKELYSSVSKYIEHIAGYLDMGFNPFSGGEGPGQKSCDDGTCSEGGETGKNEVVNFQFHVTPPSEQTDEVHNE